MRLLSNYGKAHELPAAYKFTALKEILMNKQDKFEKFEEQAKDQAPSNEETQYEIIFNKVMEFATRRRLYANQARLKGDLMDCNQVGHEHQEDPHWTINCVNWDLGGGISPKYQ